MSRLSRHILDNNDGIFGKNRYNKYKEEEIKEALNTDPEKYRNYQKKLVKKEEEREHKKLKKQKNIKRHKRLQKLKELKKDRKNKRKTNE